MTQQQRLLYLIQYLKEEESEWKDLAVPSQLQEQKRLLRAMMNLRPPKPVGKEFLAVQDAYLQQENAQKGIVSPQSFTPVLPGVYLWQGDITRLAAGAIVNAANSAMLGCFVPCHGCIDNAIHSAAGVQLRLECFRLMQTQKTPEPAGNAKITKGYNLPCRYVLHTVGPIVNGALTQADCDTLASCYQSCLQLACAYGLKSVAFCCISTGEFHFPKQKAAQIAVQTVLQFCKTNPNSPEVIFNVFQDSDYQIYKRLLTPNPKA